MTTPGIYTRFGVPVVINACGTVTRLSGGLMHPEVAEAMRQASAECVDMLALQAGASWVITRLTGAEAGIVSCGASAAVLLGAAACLTRLDAARMNRLPDVLPPRDFIAVRSQRNMYDRALEVAGGRVIEVGIPDRLSGPGVRDASAWEIAAAITPATAGIYYLAHPNSQPPLRAVAEIAREHAVPLIVDAAAQLPPVENLRRFISEGADLVAFSGGKAIGGPQASGILCGRRDLVSSALIQMLDLDVLPELWSVPPEFAALNQLAGLPHHGIGRSCKVGKEEIIGLLVALELFAEGGAESRHKEWRAILDAIAAGVPRTTRVIDSPIPLLEIDTPDPEGLYAHMAANDPPILCGLGQRHQGLLTISPAALSMQHVPAIVARLKTAPAL